jgi:putative transposase
MDQPRRQRRSIRLKGYDYSQPNAYFVTMCAHRRACLFGEITESEMRLNQTGLIAADCWREIPEHFPAASLDEWVIMPNHLHGIVIISDETDVRAQHAAPLPAKAAPLSVIVRSFKSAVTKRVNAIGATDGPIWQRNYYEHVVRDEHALDRLRRYIFENPIRWADDPDNPRHW